MLTENDLREALQDRGRPQAGIDAATIIRRGHRRRVVVRTSAVAGAGALVVLAGVGVTRVALSGATSRTVAPGSPDPAPSAALTASASMPSGGPGRDAGSPSPATVVQCDGYRFDTVPAASIAATIRLASNDPSYILQSPGVAHHQQGSCGSAPLALAYEAVSGNRVTSTLRLSGPSAPTQKLQGSAVTVRGTTGEAARPAGGLLLGWTENEQSWTLYGSGLNQAELLAVADGLTLTGTVTAEPATLPAGLKALPAGPGPADSDVWDVGYRVGGRALQLDVRTGDDAAGLLGAGATVVDVNSHRGEVASQGGTELLLWQPSPGVVAEISAAGLTSDQLIAFATTLTAAPVIGSGVG